MMYLNTTNLLAQIPPQFFAITPPWFWAIAGVILCMIEFFLAQKLKKSYKFIALLIGISAFITAITDWQMAEALGFDWRYVMYEEFNVQVMYWMGVSLALVIWVRPTLIKRKKVAIPDATEAKTVTEILPGETGKVIYEGCFWRARCADRVSKIEPNEKVYVLHRDGNTLIVTLEKMFQS
ncbi:MAG TPA: nodulation protein NfeD [Cyanobacteria bacterium UBA11371]|nr:nodulation protein NfeD [Cyanobacteria bacterium UBA11371]